MKVFAPKTLYRWTISGAETIVNKTNPRKIVNKGLVLEELVILEIKLILLDMNFNLKMKIKKNEIVIYHIKVKSFY